MAVRVWLPLALLLNVALTSADVDRALKLASQPVAARAAFHDRYLFVPAKLDVPASGPAVVQIGVITDFRRAVMAAEERGDLTRLFGPPSAADIADSLAPWRGLVAIDAYLRLPGCDGDCDPPSDIDIAVGGDTLPAVTVVRDGLRFKTGLRRPPSAVVFEALFDAASIGDTSREVRVTNGGADLAAVRVDFGAIE